MHIQKLILPLALCFSLCLPAYAVETDGDPEEPVTPVEEVVEDEPTPDETPVDDSDWGFLFGDGDGNSLPNDVNLVGVEVYGLSPVTPSDTTGLKSVLLEFIGDYDPVIVEYEYQNSNNQYLSYLREVQPDYAWLASCGMLALFVLSLFRLGGAILCRR